MKKLILLVPLLFSGCEVSCPKDKAPELEAKILQMEKEKDALEKGILVDKLYYCGALAEIASKNLDIGSFEYIGENKFLVNGEIYEPMPIDEMIKVCESDLDDFKALVAERVK